MIIKSGGRGAFGFSNNVSRGFASIGYACRKGTYSQSVYKDQRGELYYKTDYILSKEEFNQMKAEIKENFNWERRLIFSPLDENMSKEDLLSNVRATLDYFQEQTGKEFEYFTVIHDHNGRIHAHVVMFGERLGDIAMYREDFSELRKFSDELEREQQFEKDYGLEAERTKEAELEFEKEPAFEVSREKEEELER